MGQILRIAKPGDKPTEIFSSKGVQYIWAMCQATDGTIYAATGPNGQLFAVSPDGKPQVLFKSNEKQPDEHDARREGSAFRRH